MNLPLPPFQPFHRGFNEVARGEGEWRVVFGFAWRDGKKGRSSDCE